MKALLNKYIDNFKEQISDNEKKTLKLQGAVEGLELVRAEVEQMEKENDTGKGEAADVPKKASRRATKKA